MAEPSTAALYLKDLGREVLRLAGPTSGADAFGSGRQMALYEVVSLVQAQADAFGLTFDDVGLADVNPERDLLGRP